MQNIRTDLAVECLEPAGEIIPEGVRRHEEEREGIRITTVEIINEKGEVSIGKPVGKYITIEMASLKSFTDNFEGEVSVVAEEITNLLPEEGLVLVIGLGNSDITPDALGPFTANNTLATRHITGEIARSAGLEGLRPVAAIVPGVLGKTGVETAEAAHCICKQLNPAAVIAVDALASRSINRLGSTIQIANTGISPGSGVQNARKELSEQTLGVPVISVGIPTVVDMTTIAYEMLGEGNQSEKVSARGQNLMVTPREIDNLIKQSAKTLASAINKALQPSLTMEEITALTA